MVDPRFKKIGDQFVRDWMAREHEIHAAVGRLPDQFKSEIAAILAARKPGATPREIGNPFETLESEFKKIVPPNVTRVRGPDGDDCRRRDDLIIACLEAAHGVPSKQTRLAKDVNISIDVIRHAWAKRRR